MKMRLRAAFIACVFLMCIFVSACSDSGNTTEEGSGTIVYVTDSGEKYHRASCRYLRNSKNAIDLEDAKNRGYGRCSACKPSTE